MTTCPQTVHGAAGLLRGRRTALCSSKSAGRPRRGGGDCGGELIDTIERLWRCCLSTEARRHHQRSPSALDLARVECKNVLVQLPAVDAHQRVAGLKLAERFRVCASLR